MLSINEKIFNYTKDLQLPAIRKSFKDEIKKAKESNLTYEEFLFNILENMYFDRISKRKYTRIRLANFPYRKLLSSLDYESLPKDGSEKLKTFKTLDFIDEKRNIILSGNAGTGKTHIAIALGLEACIKNYKVFFSTIPSFITLLKESRSQQTFRTMEKRFQNYDLVILDELGYISFDKEGAQLLFNMLSLRAGRKSTIITTNLPFTRWNEIFNDPILTAAMVDRLTHKSYLVNMNGESYRIKETKKWMDEQNYLKSNKK